MKSSPLHLALIVDDFELLALYLGSFREEGLLVHAFASVEEFKVRVKDGVTVSGIVLDMGTANRATAEERYFLRHYEEGTVPTLIPLAQGNNNSVLFAAQKRAFLQECRQQLTTAEARGSSRKNVVLKLKICPPGMWNEELITRAFTLDLSRGGCFVVTPEDWSRRETVQIQLADTPSVIAGRIRWERPWGASVEHFPGYGVEFEEMPDSFQGDLESLLEGP